MFLKGKKELLVSIYQAVVLMLFNDVEALTFTQILEATEIEEQVRFRLVARPPKAQTGYSSAVLDLPPCVLGVLPAGIEAHAAVLGAGQSPRADEKADEPRGGEE
eukprot:COSAG01_NODE_3871_length_5604_cov_15.632334_4_plen_105_part_00